MTFSNNSPKSLLLVSIFLCLAVAINPSSPPQSSTSSPSSVNAGTTSSMPNTLGSPSFKYQDYVYQYGNMSARLQAINTKYAAIAFAMGTKSTDQEKQQLTDLLLQANEIEADFNVTRPSRQNNRNVSGLSKLKLWGKQNSLWKAIKAQEANISKYLSKGESGEWKIEYLQKVKNGLAKSGTTKVDQSTPAGQTNSNPALAAPAPPLMNCDTSAVCVKYQGQINDLRGKIVFLKDKTIGVIIASMTGMSTPGPLRQTDLAAMKSLSAQADQIGSELLGVIAATNTDPLAGADVRTFILQSDQAVGCELDGLRMTLSQAMNPNALTRVSEVASGNAHVSSLSGDVNSPFHLNQNGSALSSINNVVYGGVPNGAATFSSNSLSGMNGITNLAQSVQQQQQQNPVVNQGTLGSGPSQSQMTTYNHAVNSFVAKDHGPNSVGSSQQSVSSLSDALPTGPSPIPKSEIVTGTVTNSYQVVSEIKVAPSSQTSNGQQSTASPSSAQPMLKSPPSSIPSSIPRAPQSSGSITPAGSNASMAPASKTDSSQKMMPRVYSGPTPPPSTP